ncbi:PREDICTED: probable threonine--tRNA ligase, cytoplasmic [Ipomoea nil]|uniref:probable threonine--tRNA ligase, cytoplasmic n=1 Tax=Ipomoea nil TaxID=35883 RepID=UPI00090158E8|nr:PREDICTED: probable threonine--tRNA ligase, cytoplasmic [Ipomoea nil]
MVCTTPKLLWRLISFLHPSPSNSSFIRRFSLRPSQMGKPDKSSAANNSVPEHPKDDAYLQSVIPKRISIFKSIKSQQQMQRLSLSLSLSLSHQDRVNEWVSDSVKEGKKWNTTPLDIAKELSKSLTSNALISKVNSVLWDMSRPLEGDCKLELFTFDSDEGRGTFWHSSAHILGQSVEMKYGCKLCIGP